MQMTQKLANDLMDCLTALAISALGSVHLDANGEPYIPEVLMDAAQNYARDTFLELTEELANNAGEEWEIIPEDEKNT